MMQSVYGLPASNSNYLELAYKLFELGAPGLNMIDIIPMSMCEFLH